MAGWTQTRASSKTDPSWPCPMNQEDHWKFSIPIMVLLEPALDGLGTSSDNKRLKGVLHGRVECEGGLWLQSSTVVGQSYVVTKY